MVDDDQTANYFNQLLTSRLSGTDKLLVALNGQEAMDLLLLHCHLTTPECPVLILLDVKISVMDGFQFQEAYGQLPLPPKDAIIIVMLTTSLHPPNLDRGHQLNVAGVLNTPLTPAELDDILRHHFHRHLPA
ncbi:response regulator [Hymenobacter algoricola]|uniref:Response regulatory domain-containing protein n=1 Tax=Hymenobacter algoricola TaxID=486267 RepID=A0ABP7NLP6_9BACT